MLYSQAQDTSPVKGECLVKSLTIKGTSPSNPESRQSLLDVLRSKGERFKQLGLRRHGADPRLEPWEPADKRVHGVLIDRFNDPSAGSPTETLLRLLLPLGGRV